MAVAAQVTVAVISWNTRDVLAACLRSLRRDVDRGIAEVWVVDNASTDGSADMVRAEFPWARMIAESENLGFGSAVNVVAARTDTAFLACPNSDVEVEPGTLDRLLAAAARDRRAGAIAPRLIDPVGCTQHSVYAFPSLPARAAVTLGLSRFSSQLRRRRLCLGRHWDPERPLHVDWASGAFLVVRREAWDQAGGFDDRQWLYAEDLDLGWRLARCGWTTRYEPTAVVCHRGNAAGGQAWDEQERVSRWVAATYAWMVRRRGVVHARAYNLVSLTAMAVRVGGLSILGRLAPQRFGPARRHARVWLFALRRGWRAGPPG